MTYVRAAGTHDAQENAFEKCAATTVKISGRCRIVGSRAFADSAVRTVHIPNSVTYIASDAFSGCARIIFRTNNQTAVSYANSHGFLVLAP